LLIYLSPYWGYEEKGEQYRSPFIPNGLSELQRTKKIIVPSAVYRPYPPNQGNCLTAANTLASEDEAQI